MFEINCPYCGPRDEVEFAYGGEAHRTRPENPEDVTDKDWADYLFMRKNTAGLHSERWLHASGCGRWFNLLRDTTNHTIIASYRIGENPNTAEVEKYQRERAKK